MKSISELLDGRITENIRRGYKTLYVMLDVHGTLVRPSKETHIATGDTEESVPLATTSVDFYPQALQCLKLLKQNAKIGVKLILWTSGKREAVLDIVHRMKAEAGVEVDFINENPDYPGNSYADFSKKFCFDVLFDDKAGFDPEADWIELHKFLVKGGKQ